MPSSIVLDIEGTTSSLAYVRDHLFPYSYDQLPQWLSKEDPEVARLADEARELAGLSSGEPVLEVFRDWIRRDQKVSPLKSLQGMIWEEGFASGALRSHFYPDVAPALDRWTRAGITVHVYSSGSVQAQRNWFRYCAEGDLSRYVSEHFDTRNAGAKADPGSYARIAEALRTPPEDLLFLSDSLAELDAATTAGWRVVGLCREGQAKLGPHATVTDFGRLDLDARSPV
jgi:enolase-phosphatase E1